MEKAVVIILAAVLSCGIAAAQDGGADGGVDAGCTFGEADCEGDPPWMWCNEDNEWVETGCLPVDDSFTYSVCNCAPSDPCGWIEDSFCDEECLLVVDDMFDDSVDCAPYDGGADTDADADVDADADTDADADAGTGGGDDGCGCGVAGTRSSGRLLAAVL